MILGRRHLKSFRQDAIPTTADLEPGELAVWVDTNDSDKVYLIFNDPVEGVAKWLED